MIESWRHVSGRDPAKDGGQRGDRTPDTTIFNGVLQNLLHYINQLKFYFFSVLQAELQ